MNFFYCKKGRQKHEPQEVLDFGDSLRFYAKVCDSVQFCLQDPDHAISEKEGEAVAQQLFGLAAQYILLAHALQPSKEVYKKSLHVIKPLLPLPHLRAGLLTAMKPQDAELCREE